MRRVAAAGAIGLGLLVVLFTWWGPAPVAAEPQDAAPPAGAEAADKGDEADDSPMIDPLSVNAACYVCHLTFIREELSRVHLPEKITCIDCHGLSAAHANDENIGATPPDVLFKRGQVDASCEECHEEHDASGAKVVARFLERKLADPRPICTDCHGTHKIERAEEDGEEDEPAKQAEGAKEHGKKATAAPAKPAPQ